MKLQKQPKKKWKVMAYKILYIEDLKPGSIVHDLKASGFEAEHYNPESLSELLSKAKRLWFIITWLSTNWK